MTSYQLRLLAAFSRTDQFFKSIGASLLSGPKNLELIKELEEIIGRLTQLSPSQKRNPRVVRNNLAAIKGLADELRHELLKVARTARALSDEAPELRLKFAMPRSPGHLALRKAAKAVIANSSQEVQNLFIQAELQPDYLEVIAQKLEKFEFELGNKADGRKLTSPATSEVATNFQRGMMVLRKLDAAIRNRVTDRLILDQWRLARSVELLHRPPPKYRSKLIQNLAQAGGGDLSTPPTPEQTTTNVEASDFASTELASQVEPSQVEPSQVEPSQVEPLQAEASQVEASQVESSRVEASKVEVSTMAASAPAAEGNSEPPAPVVEPEPAATALGGEEALPTPVPRAKPAKKSKGPVQDDLFGGFGG